MNRTLMLAGFLLAASPVLADEKPVLTVYAPEYFVGEYGPGKQMAEGFEKTCGCTVNVLGVDVLPRLTLEGDKTPADVAIGLTIDVMDRAAKTGLFAPHNEDPSKLTVPVKWTDPTFLPFDWSDVAFIYDKTKVTNPPKSFDDLLNAPDDAYKIAIEDPRTSALGLALLLWVKSVYGDKAPEAWAKLAPKVLTVTPDWSDAYGLFTSGEADMVLSFTTSPAYHIIAEHDDTKVSALFPEGHYFYVETAAQIKGTKHPELAQKFMDYLMSDSFQSMIGVGNWSYPAIDKPGFLPPEFADLPKPEKTLFYPPAEAEALRAPALAEWAKAFRK